MLIGTANHKHSLKPQLVIISCYALIIYADFKCRFERKILILGLTIADSVGLRFNTKQRQISPCNINAFSVREVMRIKDMITQHGFRSVDRLRNSPGSAISNV